MDNGVVYTPGRFEPRYIPASQDEIYDAPSMQRTVKYLNYTNRNVTVVGRTGIKFVVKHNRSRCTHKFIVREEFMIPYHCLDDIYTQLMDRDDADPANSKIVAFKKSFVNQYENVKAAWRRKPTNIYITVDTVVDSGELKADKHLYLTGVDTLVSYESPACCPDHPYSDVATFNRRYDEILDTNCTMGLVLDLVDNTSAIGPRYYVLAGKVHELQTRVDDTRECGLYYGEIASGELKVRFHLLDELEDLGFYKSKEEALSGGDIKLLRMEEISRLQHDLQLGNIETNRHKLEAERLRSELSEKETRHKLTLLDLEFKLKETDRLNQLMVAEIDKEKKIRDEEFSKKDDARKEAAAARNDYYDSKSSSRKETSELIKFIPALIAAGLGIWVAILKGSK